MAEKPTYEELERRVQALEIIESECKSSKEASGDSEAQCRLLFEHVNIGIFIAQNGYLKVPNPYLSKLLGYPLADLEEQPFSLFIHPEHQPLVNTRHQERLSGKKGLPEKKWGVDISRYHFRTFLSCRQGGAHFSHSGYH
jgi:PAS domain-containing protein